MKNRVRNGHSKNAIFPHKKEKANIFPTIKEILGPIVKGASRQVLDKKHFTICVGKLGTEGQSRVPTQLVCEINPSCALLDEQPKQKGYRHVNFPILRDTLSHQKGILKCLLQEKSKIQTY